MVGSPGIANLSLLAGRASDVSSQTTPSGPVFDLRELTTERRSVQSAGRAAKFSENFPRA